MKDDHRKDDHRKDDYRKDDHRKETLQKNDLKGRCPSKEDDLTVRQPDNFIGKLECGSAQPSLFHHKVNTFDYIYKLRK